MRGAGVNHHILLQIIAHQQLKEVLMISSLYKPTPEKTSFREKQASQLSLLMQQCTGFYIITKYWITRTKELRRVLISRII